MRIYLLSAFVLLAACGKQEAPPPAPKAAAPASAPVTTEDAPAANPDYVVDEPLPPFDEGGGRPQLVAQAAVSSGGGTMFLYEAPDGTRLLRFEDLNVSATPDLEVVLTQSAAPTSDDFAEAIRIGALKGARGNQNYLVSSKIVLKPLQSVAVISRPQGAVIAFAPLTAPKK